MKNDALSRLAVLVMLAPALAGAECPGADRLQEALAIVNQANPVLLAERDLSREQAAKPPWSAYLTVGYSITDTLESGDAGPNAAIRIKIPLWDNSTRIEAAKERAAATAKQDAIQAQLLAGIQSLCEQAHRVRALEAAYQFAGDKLKYRQERVNQNIEPAEALWGEASAYQTAKHEWEQESAKLSTSRLVLAHQYGGETEWRRLLTLLEAMTR